jgi:hypothetical protein
MHREEGGDVERNHPTMIDRHDRTVRLLEARLEGLASVCERSPTGTHRFDSQVAALAGATRRAIELELLSAEEASAVWAAVAGRHPAATWCQAGPLAA